MEDKSFLYFTQDEVIEKMNIDSRLVESFKRVMKTIQKCFNANGYTSERNYFEYLKKYLLDSGNQNLEFQIESMEDMVGGYYYKNKHKICINPSRLKTSDNDLVSTLCHVLIHFLVI